MYKPILVLILILVHIGYGQKPYHGAEYRTINTFQYGRFEVRMKSANGSGVVSSFFTIRDYWADGLDGSGNWNEIDWEYLGNHLNKVQTNIISAGETHHEQLIDVDFNPNDEFYTYAFEWAPEYIAFFINDSMVRYDNNWYVETFTNPQKIMMNIWQPIWEDWVGVFDENILPVYAFYDWVKYYSYTPGVGNYGSGNNFSFEWVDEFNAFDQNRWQKATHTWSSNNAQFIQENAVFMYGHLILCLTDNSTYGYSGDPLNTSKDYSQETTFKMCVSYPNPFNSTFTIKLSGDQKNSIKKINIFDLNGRVVWSIDKFNFQELNLELSFPYKQLSSGVYYGIIIYEDRKNYFKITYLE